MKSLKEMTSDHRAQLRRELELRLEEVVRSRERFWLDVDKEYGILREEVEEAGFEMSPNEVGGYTIRWYE